MNTKQGYKRPLGLFFSLLVLPLFSTACSLVERTPNQAFVNDFISEVTDYGDFTSSAGELNPETGYVDYSLNEFNYNSEDREITVSVTFVDQNGSEVTKESRYLFNASEGAGWVIST